MILTPMKSLNRVAVAALLAAALPAPAASPDLRLDQLYAGSSAEGPAYAPATKSLAGKRVRIAGYAAPAYRAEAGFFMLTGSPKHVCPFCVNGDEWPDDIVVVFTRGAPPAGGSNPLAVTGTLEIGAKRDAETGLVSRVRLLDAVVEPAR